jgi:hypothetical protein
MATHFAVTCHNCGCPISEVEYRCPYCHAARRSKPGLGGPIAILLGIALGAWILLAQIDKTTGSDHLAALRDWLMP